MITTNVFERYGIKELSVEEELYQNEFAKRTRKNKMDIIDKSEHIRGLIETIEHRARTAPELDDEKHSKLVQELMDHVNEAYNHIFAAVMVGHQ